MIFLAINLVSWTAGTTSTSSSRSIRSSTIQETRTGSGTQLQLQTFGSVILPGNRPPGNAVTLGAAHSSMLNWLPPTSSLLLDVVIFFMLLHQAVDVPCLFLLLHGSIERFRNGTPLEQEIVSFRVSKLDRHRLSVITV